MLSKLSVRRPFTVFVAVVIVLVLGFLSFQNMSMDFLPSMEFPYAIVMTTYPGASPEEVERAVTEPVEQAMSRINNVKTVQSMSNNNMSVVMMEFNDGTDMGSTTVDMRESLDQVTAQWDDAIGNPTIMKLNPDMMPIMVAALDYEDTESTEVTKKAEQDIIPEIESVNGVASVNQSGGISKKIEVIIQQDKIDKMNRKVQDAIDGKLKDAKEKLEKGDKKLKDGKSKLDSQKKEAAEKIAKGETKLNDATDKIKDGLKTIDENIKQVKEQEKTLKKSEKQLKTGKAQIASGKKKLEGTISNLQTTKKQLETLKTSLEKLQTQEAAIQAQIDGLGDKAPAELKTSLSAIQTQIGVLQKTLKTMGIEQAKLPEKIAEVDSGLTQAMSGLTELLKQEKTLKKNETKINTAKKKIKAGLKKLNAAKTKLQKGKISTSEALEELNKQKILSSIQISVAEAQMNSGSEKMTEARKELKTAKKTTKENARLDKIITKEMVENVLKAQNFDMPSGYLTEEDASYLVRIGDKMESVDNIQDLVVCDMDLDGLEPIKLGDVADVAETNNADDVYTVVNGNPAVLLTLQKDKFEELQKNNEGLSVSIMMNQGVYIDLVVDAVIQNLLFGAILAILILLFFLRDIRPTIIVACSIPLSVVAAIVAMYFSGVTLNIISLSGLALGVGMLVDNSVVVIENIFRMRREGASVQKAAVEGAKQVGGAIVASTLTTVCVFAPIIFTEGITKQLFVDLALTLAYTLGASLLVALTLVPAMSAGMIKRINSKESRIIEAVQNGYGRILAKVLRFKPLVFLGSIVFLILFAALAIRNGMSMMPDMESTQLTLSLTIDEEKEFSEVKDISNQVIQKVREIPDVESIGAYAGSGSGMSMLTGGGSDHTVSMYAILNEDRELNNEELKAKIEEQTKGIDCEVSVDASAMDMSALMGQGIQMNIYGRNLDKLQSISEDIMGYLEKVDGLEEITNGLEDAGKEYRMSVNKAKAMKYTLTVAQVYQQIYAKLKEASSASTLSTDTDDIGMYVSSSADEELTRKDIRNMKLEYTDTETQKTKKVKLSKIAEFSVADSPNSIYREGQRRFLTVRANIQDGKIVSNVSADVKKALADYEMPAGYELTYEGEDASTEEAMGQVLLMMGLGIVLMYLIMVAQFQSLLSPFIILFTIPLAFTGGFMGLWISGSDVSVIAMIGFVMLAGIIVNNGIVLVDYINQLRRAGTEKKEAIIEAGRTRLRPIFMTALTTILGLFPMVFGKSMGTDMTRPMAIVTIGGLIYGTILTLFVVPCLYDLMNRNKDITEHFDD